MSHKPSVKQLRQDVGRERRAKTRTKIIASAFDLFGQENGLFVRVEDIAAHAKVTRATFYNHFTNMIELREAVTYECTHDFFTAVSVAIKRLDDPCERMALAPKYYLKRAQEDRHWAWSIINLSANGIAFGIETYRQAELTTREGIDAGAFSLSDSRIGRDLVLGTCLSAFSTMLRDETPVDYPEMIVKQLMMSLGLSADLAHSLAYTPLPLLQTVADTD